MTRKLLVGGLPRPKLEAKIVRTFPLRRYGRLASIIIGQNLLGFDVYIHRIYCKYLGIKPDYSYISRIYDTNCIAKAIKKDAGV